MKSRILKFIPAFLRNFNIEQRVQSKLDEIDHSNKPAPWHQSTAHAFEIIKGFILDFFFSKIFYI